MGAKVDLEEYRVPIRLDEPFPVPDQAPESELESIVEGLLQHLSSERLFAPKASAGTWNEKRQALRAILTARGPEPLPPWFHLNLDRGRDVPQERVR